MAPCAPAGPVCVAVSRRFAPQTQTCDGQVVAVGREGLPGSRQGTFWAMECKRCTKWGPLVHVGHPQLPVPATGLSTWTGDTTPVEATAQDILAAFELQKSLQGAGERETWAATCRNRAACMGSLRGSGQDRLRGMAEVRKRRCETQADYSRTRPDEPRRHPSLSRLRQFWTGKM